MAELDPFFKYKIGEHLSLRRPPGNNDPHKWYAIVTARRIDECPAGAQRFYIIQTENIAALPFQCLEEALEPFVRPPNQEERDQLERFRYEEMARIRAELKAKVEAEKKSESH